MVWGAEGRMIRKREEPSFDLQKAADEGWDGLRRMTLKARASHNPNG